MGICFHLHWSGFDAGHICPLCGLTLTIGRVGIFSCNAGGGSSRVCVPSEIQLPNDGGMPGPAGLTNGVLLRTEVDRVAGSLSDTRTRFLGTRPPRLSPVSVRGRRSMLALSSRPWLGCVAPPFVAQRAVHPTAPFSCDGSQIEWKNFHIISVKPWSSLASSQLQS